MPWFLYISNVFLARSESAMAKYCGRRGGKSMVFNTAKSSSATVVCLISALIFGFTPHIGTATLSIFYGMALSLATYSGIRALNSGSMAIASMLASFSLIIPFFFGMIFLGERPSLLGYIGLALVLLSIIVLNTKGGRVGAECWIFSILTMIANGICSVIQKQHQILYPGKYQTELLLFSMLVSALIFILISAFSKNITAKDFMPQSIRSTLSLGSISGVCHCFANLTVLYLASQENATVLFPVLSAANMIGSCLVGRLIFKERLAINQLISLALGIASVVLLKI